jgi:hypothetical protein
MYRGINDFKHGYQPTTNLVKDDLHADSHIILNRWKNHFCQLSNTHGVNVIRQSEIHRAELLVPEPSAFDI